MEPLKGRVPNTRSSAGKKDARHGYSLSRSAVEDSLASRYGGCLCPWE